MFCDTGRCRASIKAGRQGGDAGAQGKPQPDAHGWRELKGTDAFSRTAGRKITADGKEGPGDRRVHFTLASPPARLRWRHGTARTRHDGHITEPPQGHAPHGRVKAEPPATSFDIPHRVHSQGKWRGEERTCADGAHPFPEGTVLPGSLVVHARTMPVRKKGLPENGRTGSPFIKALQCSQTSISPEKAGLRPPPGCYLPDS